MFFTILNFVINILIIVLIIGVLVLVHEFGHFIAARLSGMLVKEFSIGLGPKLFSRKYGETEYMVKAFPIGGYVKILGEEGNEDEFGEVKTKEKHEVDVNNPRSFKNKSAWARFFVMIAGVTMNYLLAIIIFYIWLGTNGWAFDLPSSMDSYEPAFATKRLVQTGPLNYDGLLENSMAFQANLPAKGEIKSINDQNLTYKFEYKTIVTDNIGKEVNLEICGDSCGFYKVNVPEDGIIGFYLPPNYIYELSYDGINRYFSGFENSIDNLRLMGYSIGSMMSRAKQSGNYEEVATNSLSSPVALYFVVDAFKQFGVLAVLRLVGEFSFSLAIVNILPIPALDGGRILLLGIEAIRKKPFDPKVENSLIAISFYALLLLMLIVVLKDIVYINVIKSMFKI